jgi:hypothetical protein
VQAFGKVLDVLGGPIIAFCCVGTRSASLWPMSQAQPGTAEEIVATTELTGYGLAALLLRSEERIEPCSGPGLWTKCSNTMTLMAAAKKHQTEMNQAV